MINQLPINDGRLAMDSRLSIGDFAAVQLNGESLIANALRMDNCKSLIGNSVGVTPC